MSEHPETSVDIPPEAVHAATQAYWEAQGVSIGELGSLTTAQGYMRVALDAAFAYLREVKGTP